MLPVQSVLPDALARLLARAPHSEGKFRFAWRLAVGPSIDRVTSVTMSSGDRRLVVRVPDPVWRREVERSLPMIHDRLASLLGAATVSVIDIRD